MNKSKKNLIGIVVSAIVIVTIIVLLILFGGKQKKEQGTVIGLVLSGSSTEIGWNGLHYNGVKNACDKLGAELLVKENAKEFTGECNAAIKELAEDGASMMILSSYGHAEEAKEQVKEYPGIVFYVNSSEHHDVNMTSYFARMYQARYLAGIVAGMKTEGNRIGYVAAMSNNEVNRGINAFTLGVKHVNPEAEVIVAWSGAWDDAEAEKKAAEDLIEEVGVDVLTYHQNLPNVIEVAEAAGIYSIGYHEALEDCTEKYLTSVVCKWEMVYEAIIREYLIGKGNVKDNYWIGMEKNAVGLSEYSQEVTPEIQAAIEEASRSIMSGKDVFSGVIYDNEGTLRCDEMEAISDEVILEQFDWFVEGVVIYEK